MCMLTMRWLTCDPSVEVCCFLPPQDYHTILYIALVCNIVSLVLLIPACVIFIAIRWVLDCLIYYLQPSSYMYVFTINCALSAVGSNPTGRVEFFQVRKLASWFVVGRWIYQCTDRASNTVRSGIRGLSLPIIAGLPHPVRLHKRCKALTRDYGLP